MSGSFVLTQGAGQKLEFAINRNGGDASLVEWLSRGNNIAKVMKLASGEFELKPVVKVSNSLYDYWKNREGLQVTTSFSTRVLPYANKNDTADISTCDCVDLKDNMYYEDMVVKYFGGWEKAKQNAFKLNQIRAFIDSFVNGEASALLRISYLANVFFVVGEHGDLFAVLLVWYSDDRGWHVHACDQNEPGRWHAGGRLFRNKC